MVEPGKHKGRSWSSGRSGPVGTARRSGGRQTEAQHTRSSWGTLCHAGPPYRALCKLSEEDGGTKENVPELNTVTTQMPTSKRCSINEAGINSPCLQPEYRLATPSWRLTEALCWHPSNKAFFSVAGPHWGPRAGRLRAFSCRQQRNLFAVEPATVVVSDQDTLLISQKRSPIFNHPLN